MDNNGSRVLELLCGEHALDDVTSVDSIAASVVKALPGNLRSVVSEIHRCSLSPQRAWPLGLALIDVGVPGMLCLASWAWSPMFAKMPYRHESLTPAGIDFDVLQALNAVT